MRYVDAKTTSGKVVDKGDNAVKVAREVTDTTGTFDDYATAKERAGGREVDVLEYLELAGYSIRSGADRLNSIRARLDVAGVSSEAETSAPGDDEDEAVSNALWEWQTESLSTQDDE